MIGVIVNTITVLLGGSVGSLVKKGLPEKVIDTVMIGLGLCTIYIGIDGALKGNNTLILILSMVLGAIVGALIDIDDKLNRLGKWFEKKLSKPGDKTPVAQGFVTGCLIFCVGSMTIVGSLNSGILHDHKMIYIKSLLDLVSSTMLAASLGYGVILAAGFVFVFQGSIVLLAQQLSGILNEAAIAEMTCAGSVIIIALGLNLVGISKFKLANYLPAIFFAPLFTWLFSLLPFTI